MNTNKTIFTSLADMRQLIIARKDLQMSPGKLAAQCCHAAMAFLTRDIAKGIGVMPTESGYQISLSFDTDTYEQWICGIFTKTICEAKNKNQLLKAVKLAEELGLKENQDFFLIKDACLTELEPEEVDENGVGRVLTCIGFRPLPSDVIQKVSKKFQLYK